MTDPVAVAVAAAPSRRRTIAALIVVVVLLATHVTARKVAIPGEVHLGTNILAAAALVVLAVASAMTLDELGLERRHLRSGLVWGGGALALAVAVVGVAVVVPAAADAIRGSGVAPDGSAVAFDLLVGIPLGTVLLEELAFRGVLLGLARRLWSTRMAVVGTSLLFGLWHIPPALTEASTGTGASAAAGDFGTAATVAGTVAFTTVAGLVFSWLRLRSDSLVAPVLAHWAVNGASLAAAFAVAS